MAIASLEKWQGIDGRGRKAGEANLAQQIDDILAQLRNALGE